MACILFYHLKTNDRREQNARIILSSFFFLHQDTGNRPVCSLWLLKRVVQFSWVWFEIVHFGKFTVEKIKYSLHQHNWYVRPMRCKLEHSFIPAFIQASGVFIAWFVDFKFCLINILEYECEKVTKRELNKIKWIEMAL